MKSGEFLHYLLDTFSFIFVLRSQQPCSTAMSLGLKTLYVLERVGEWLVENKHSIHLGKTDSILFKTKKRLSRTKSLKVSCNEAKIASQRNVPYLVIILDLGYI